MNKFSSKSQKEEEKEEDSCGNDFPAWRCILPTTSLPLVPFPSPYSCQIGWGWSYGHESCAGPAPPAHCLPTATSCKPNNRIYGQPDVVTARCQPKLFVFIQKSAVKAGSQNPSCSQDLKHLFCFDDDPSIEELHWWVLHSLS